MTEYPLPPIQDNRSDCPPYTLRRGRDYPTPPPWTALVCWPVILPLACAEFGAAVVSNNLQFAEMMMTRRMR